METFRALVRRAMLSRSLVLTAVVASVLPMNVAAEDSSDADYVKVEIRGTLTTGVIAIGGETTGIVVRSGGSAWELDLAGDAELKKKAEQLDKQTVVVTGDYRRQKGVEVPERHIVRVKSLEAAR
jgi:hypothetical protein